MNLCIAEVLLDHGTKEGKEGSQGGGPSQPWTPGLLSCVHYKPEPAKTPTQTLLIQGEGRRAGVRRCAHLRLVQ